MPARQVVFAHELTENLHKSFRENSPISIVANGRRYNIAIENMVLDESIHDFVFSIEFRVTGGIEPEPKDEDRADIGGGWRLSVR